MKDIQGETKIASKTKLSDWIELLKVLGTILLFFILLVMWGYLVYFMFSTDGTLSTGFSSLTLGMIIIFLVKILVSIAGLIAIPVVLVKLWTETKKK
jgi:hypothetical protein